MAEDKGPVYRVTQPFSFDDNGQQYAMRTGDLVEPGHPALTPGRMGLFEEVQPGSGMRDYAVRAAEAIETTTAEPGAKRSVRPGRAG
jgi:hypothetical protein